MRSTKFFLVAVTVQTMALLALSRQSVAEEKTTSKTAKIYSSPAEVFDAFNEAQKTKDWRTLFLCYAPQFREMMLYDMWGVCFDHHREPAYQKILKKYGPTYEAFLAEYHARYKKMHGIDTEDIADSDLMIETLNALITDKVGFFEAWMNMDPPTPFDKETETLSNVTVYGDKATGRVLIARDNNQRPKANGKTTEEIAFVIHFCKSKQGWLIEDDGEQEK